MMNRVGRAIAENSKFSLAVCDSDQKIHQTHLNQIRNEQINHNGRFSDFDLQYGGKVNSSPHRGAVAVVEIVFIVHMFLIRSKQTNRCHLRCRQGNKTKQNTAQSTS